MSRSIPSDKLNSLPPYLFVDLDRKKSIKKASGADVIDLGIGDPDRPTPDFIINAMTQAIRESAYHRYPHNAGLLTFRESAARFLKRRFGFAADPVKNILTCIGSKEGVAHLPVGILNPGDTVLLSSISYPVYRSGAIFAGANIYEMATNEENGWIPDFTEIPTDIAKQSRLLWVNYPNNPTTTVVPLSFYAQAVQFCQKYDIILASDNAYGEVFYDDNKPGSLWQVNNINIDTFPGIEFHSLSKTFNMTGWRLAFAVGNPEVISALSAVKNNSDSGQFSAIQAAGAVALDNADHKDVLQMRNVYQQRRDVLCAGLNDIGCKVSPPQATFFVWGKCPEGYDSRTFCNRCLEEANVVIVPGEGFSSSGKNYFRVALTVEVERIHEAVERLKKIEW